MPGNLAGGIGVQWCKTFIIMIIIITIIIIIIIVRVIFISFVIITLRGASQPAEEKRRRIAIGDVSDSEVSML